MIRSGNLFADVSDSLPAEQVFTLAESRGVKIERIVSTGQASPPGFWYDQDADEFVLLLQGRASLQVEGEAMPRALVAGSWAWLPAHCRHRVEATSSDPPAVWLAVHA